MRGLWMAGSLLLLGACRGPLAVTPPPEPKPKPKPTELPAPAATSAVAPPRCDRIAGSGRIKNIDVRVCLKKEEDSAEPLFFMRIEDGAGQLLADGGAFMAFKPARSGDVRVAFRDVTGDGVDDILLEAPFDDSHGPRATCSYVINGAELAPFDPEAPAPSEFVETMRPVSRALSFAAAVAPAPATEPWAHIVSSSAPIPKKDACALLRAARAPGGFEKSATADGEVVGYDEPGMPHCPIRAKTKAARRLVPKLEPLDCEALTCAKGAAFCWNHEPNPSAEFYLFAKGEGGRFKVRAIAVYRGD